MWVEQRRAEQLSISRKVLPVPESRTNLKKIKLNVSHQHSSSKQGATHKSYPRIRLSKPRGTFRQEKAFLSDSCSKCEIAVLVFLGISKITDNFLPKQTLFQCGQNFLQ